MESIDILIVTTHELIFRSFIEKNHSGFIEYFKENTCAKFAIKVKPSFEYDANIILLPNLIGIPTIKIITDMILNTRPKFVLLVGLIAGITNEINLGNIIIAEDVIDYENAMLSYSNSKKQLLRHSKILTTRKEKSIDLINSLNYFLNIAESYKEGKNVHFGQILSSKNFLMDSKTLLNLKNYYPRVLGLDFESLNITEIISSLGDKSPQLLVIHSVSDLANNKKEIERINSYCDNVVNFVMSFIISGVFPRVKHKLVCEITISESEIKPQIIENLLNDLIGEKVENVVIEGVKIN